MKKLHCVCIADFLSHMVWEWISHTIAMWPLVFANAAIDYVSDNYTSGLVGQLPAGSYLNGGLNFTMKQAAAQTSYITGFNMGGMFGASGSSTGGKF